MYKNYTFVLFRIHNLLPFLVKLNIYSDFGEDLVISHNFDIKAISYIDIGAGHPIIGSNTYLFYKNGCSGIIVEPIKFHYRLHKFFRRRDTQINRLVDENGTIVEFYEFNPTQYSTASQDEYNQMIKSGMKERKRYLVETISINTIMKEFTAGDYFLSIDCEGYDYDIIKAIKWSDIKKPVAIIHEITKDEMKAVELKNIMNKNGYIEIFKSKNNLVYKLK